MIDREQRPYRQANTTMRTVYDATMALLLLGMASLMFFGPSWHIPQIEAIDTLNRYAFGIVCAIYGAFRAYRAIKQ